MRKIRLFFAYVCQAVNATGLTINTQFTQKRYIGLVYSPTKIQYVPNGIERTRFANTTFSTALRKKMGDNV